MTEQNQPHTITISSKIAETERDHAPGGKTALVLAGGGILGAVYEIGALRAVDDLLINRTVKDFDIYVGTSAGSMVSAMLANGMGPQEMMQTINDTHPEIRGIGAGDIFHSNILELFGRLTRLPQVLLRNGQHYLITRSGDRTMADLLWDFAELLPTGLYSGDSLEKYVEEVLTRPDCVNRFDLIEKDLFIIATDLDSGERTVFGKGGKGIVPISKAVAASSAIPVLYKPVRIFGKEYVDGSLRGTASLDLAVESGAKLVVCINPLVPLDAKQLYGKDEHIGDEGVRTILNQVVRILMHAGLRYHIKSLHRQHPDVDFILIEPRPDDQKMFGYDLMDYGSRLRAAEHGFESVTVGLTERYRYIKRILRRHGIEITRRFVTEELEEMRQSDFDPDVMFNVMGLNRVDAMKTEAEQDKTQPVSVAASQNNAKPKRASATDSEQTSSIEQTLANLETKLSKLDSLLSQQMSNHPSAA